MCYAKPGPRCSRHAKQELDRAFQSKDASRIREALDAYRHTPAGIKETAETDPGYARTLKIERAQMIQEYKGSLAASEPAVFEYGMDDSQVYRNYLVKTGFNEDDWYFCKNNFGLPHKVVEAFSEGDCWRLAFALKEKMDCTVWIITEKDELEKPRCDMWFNHMLVRSVDGRFIDVDGVHSEEELRASDWFKVVDDGVLLDVSDDFEFSQASVSFYPDMNVDAVADHIVSHL